MASREPIFVPNATAFDNPSDWRNRLESGQLRPRWDGGDVVGETDRQIRSTVAAPRDPTAPIPTHTKRLLRTPGATALIIGGVVGTGVFTLPSSLAPYGMLAIVGLVVVTIGAIAVGLMFANLARRIPRAGGPYAYAHEEFGDLTGFTAAWSYWLTTAVGNAGIVVSWVFYVNAMLGWDSNDLTRNLTIAMFGLWIPVCINLIGLDQVRRFQIVTVFVKLVPLVFMSTVGLFFAFSRWEFPAWNPTGDMPWAVITTTGALVLFIYLGVEDASSAAGRVEDPARTVPRATIIGTLACAVLYVLSTVAIFGLVSTTELAGTGAPFSAAMAELTGVSWSGQAIAFFAVVSGIGALNGLTLLVSEVPRAAAADGIFPRVFTRLTRRDAAWVGLLTSAGLATILVVISSLGEGGLSAFNTLILMTGITSALPYFLSALASGHLLLRGGKRPHPGALARDLGITIVAGAFSIWCIFGSGITPILLTGALMLIGYVVYGIDQSRRRQKGTVHTST